MTQNTAPASLEGVLVSRSEGRATTGLRYRLEEWSSVTRRDEQTLDLVAMHGMGGSPHNWDLVAPHLGNARFTRIEMPLHEGLCAKIDINRPVASADLVRVVTDTVDELSSRRMLIVGHSMGVYFAVKCATLLRDKVQGVISLSGSMFGLSDSLLASSPHDADRWELRQLRVSFAGAVLMTLIPPAWPLRWLLDNVHMARIGLHPYLNKSIVSLPEPIGDCFRGQGGIAAIKVVAAARRDANIREAFAECPVPIQALVGDRDPLLVRSDYDELREFVVSGCYATLRGVGHWPHIEAPRRVAQFIREAAKNVAP
jgi:pimeloyl-ACP methyl ester carboxylesterase